MKKISNLKNTFHKKSYFYKMLIPFALLFIFTIFIASAFSYTYISRGLKKEVYNETENLLNNISSFINRNAFEESYRCLLDKFLGTGQYNEIPTYFYSGDEPSNIDLYNLQTHLKKSLYSYQYIQTLSVYSKKQDLMITVNEGYYYDFLYTENNSYYKTLKDVVNRGMANIDTNDFYYYEQSNELFIINPLPVYARDQEAVGFFITKIDLLSLMTDIENEYNANGYTLAVSDSVFSNMLVSENKYGIDKDWIVSSLSSSEIQNNRNGYLLSTKAIADTKMMLTIVKPYSEINAKATDFTKNFICISLTSMLVLLGIILLITQYLYRPIKSIIFSLNKSQKLGGETTKLKDIEFINQSVMQLNSRLESMDEILKSNQNLIEYRLMMDLLQNKTTTEDSFFNSLHMIEKSPPYKKYCIAILDLSFPAGSNQSTLQKYEYLRIKIQNLISREYSKYILLNIVYSANSIVMLINTDQKETLSYISKGIYNLVNSSIILPFNLAVSNLYEDILLTHAHYESAEKMHKYSFLIGYKNIFTSETLFNNERNDYIISTEDVQKIEAKLKSSKIVDLKALVMELSNKMRKGYSIDSIFSSLSRISNIIIVYLQNPANNYSFEKTESLKKDLALAKNIDDYIDVLFDILNDFSHAHKLEDNSFYDALIEEIIEYIECNLQSDSSLASLAIKFNLSQGHLSKLFKKHTGYSFSKYIIDKKMEKAAYLIKNGNYKIKEISESLGYFKLSYFAKVFKEKYGVTPVEFRKKNTWM